MIRLALWLLGALLLAGIVHLTTVLLLPRMATQDAYARVSAIAPVNAVIPVPSPTPEKAVMPFMDPAFQVSVCRYDLSRGPLKFSVPISQTYTSVSFYDRDQGARVRSGMGPGGAKCARGGTVPPAVNAFQQTLRAVRATTAAATWSAHFRREIPARRIGVSFDSDDRKDDDGR